MMWTSRTSVGAGVLALLSFAALIPPGRADPVAPRTEVPIAQTVLPDGAIRYSVPVSVGGGPPTAALLDTGSFGLRVLARAADAGRFEDTGVERAYPFGGGVRFNGPLARATIAVGGAETARAVLLQVVRTVDCARDKPRCPAAHLDASAYRIGGDGYPGQGFDAILGISLRKAPAAMAADNPLAEIGRRWIVVLPRPGAAEPGRLVIDPSDDEATGFVTAHLEPQPAREGDGARGWRDTTLPGCLADADGGRRACGSVVLDTGAPGMALESSVDADASGWKAGARATLEVTGGTAPVTLPFVVGADRASAVRVLRPSETAPTRIFAGILPFFSYAVLFDAWDGTIGFKPRDGQGR